MRWCMNGFGGLVITMIDPAQATAAELCHWVLWHCRAVAFCITSAAWNMSLLKVRHLESSQITR